MLNYQQWDQQVQGAVDFLRKEIPVPPQVLVILSGGIRQLVDAIESPKIIDATRVPGFPVSAVEGHTSQLVCGTYRGVPLVVSLGRTHYYEGLPLQQITIPLHALARLGATTLLITNSAGGISNKCTPGDLMIISDHINFQGDNPLRGIAVHSTYQFPDMTNAYDVTLRATAAAVARAQGTTITEGVYLSVAGPNYETPAEIRAFRQWGADAVGMSTVPEVIVANFHRMQVLGVSCIANLAADLHAGGMNHHEVLQAMQGMEPKLCNLLLGVIAAKTS